MSDNFWTNRITNANKLYIEWENQFKCRILEDYYKGNQWKNRRDYITVNYNPYTLNLFKSTIDIKLANLVFQKPSFLVNPKPGGADWSADMAAQSAGIKQDLLNNIVQNPGAHFAKRIKKAARDSFFRFGMIEVGYAADWRHPEKEDPLLADHGKESNPKARVVDDNEVPVNERFYFKRINPKRFRVSVSDADELDQHEWVGYYEFYYTKLLRKTKGIHFPKDAQVATFSADYNDAIVGNLFSGSEGVSQKPGHLRLMSEGSVSKVWHIWDLVEKKRLMLLDKSYDTLWEGDFERLNLLDLRWDEDFEGWLPVPPAFHWLSPQDEINEAREQLRSFRRRFTRKYQAVDGKVEPLEVEKFVSGPDGIVIKVKERDAISEISNAPINPSNEQSLLMGKDDFNIVSATSTEARGAESDRETATAVKESAARAQIRESAEQMDFTQWVCIIGREALQVAKENLSEGLWVKATTFPNEQGILQDLQVMQPAYNYITGGDVTDGYDFEIDIDVMNQTPAAMVAQQQSIIQFLSIVHQFPEVSLSPVLIRKVALVCGVRDELVIHQMQQTAALSMAAKAAAASAQNQQQNPLQQAAQQAGGQGGNNAGNVANSVVSQMNPPTVQQTNDQIRNQLVQ